MDKCVLAGGKYQLLPLVTWSLTTQNTRIQLLLLLSASLLFAMLEAPILGCTLCLTLKTTFIENVYFIRTIALVVHHLFVLTKAQFS